MRRSVDDWAEEVESRPVVTLLKGLGLLIAVGLVVMTVLWGFGVVTAPWKGKGDAYQQKESSSNWVNAQRGFHDLDNKFETYKTQVEDAKAALAEVQKQYPTSNGTPYDPGAQQVANARTTLTGLTQQCQNVVTQYNTDSQSYMTQDFKDAGLPEKLDPAACR
jgi:hypothetical protein